MLWVYVVSLGLFFSPLDFCNLHLHKQQWIWNITFGGDVPIPAVCVTQNDSGRIWKRMCVPLFTCLYFAPFPLIRGSPYFKSVAHLLLFQNVQLNFKTHSLSSLENLHNTRLSCGGKFLQRWASLCVCVPVDACVFVISCTSVSACISIHDLCIISLSNLSLCAFLPVSLPPSQCHWGYHSWIFFRANFCNLLMTCTWGFPQR